MELTDLRNIGTGLALVGFAEAEIADLFSIRTAGPTDPDEVPEPLGERVTAAGDVWLLGGTASSVAIAPMPRPSSGCWTAPSRT